MQGMVQMVLMCRGRVVARKVVEVSSDGEGRRLLVWALGVLVVRV